MCDLIKMATIFAKEMIEHNLECGATHLNAEFIADQSCDIAYKIHEKVKSYGYEDTSKKDIEKMVHKAMSEYKEDPKPIHHP